MSGSSVAIAERSGKLLSEIAPSIQKSSKLIQEISASSTEQNTGASQINTALQQLNQVVQSNASAAEEMAASAEELLQHSGQLDEAVTILTAREANGLKSKKVSHHPTPSSNGHKTFKAAVNTVKKGASINMQHDAVSDADFETYHSH